MKTKFNNLVMDFYELTMGQAYFNEGMQNKVAYFDLFFRRVPDGGSFVIANGIQKCAKYLEQFHLNQSDIEYLKSLNLFTENYLDYLSNVRFTGDMWAVNDGTVVFANEPIITVRAPIIEAQLVETALLLYFNRSSLITTKTHRIVRSAKGRAVMEFGTRRAQGESAAVEGALDAYIAGVNGTACTQTGKEFNVKVLGTMAHSFVQSFENEYEAFVAYAKSFPDACTLLIDTYHTLESGVPNAIKVYKNILKPMGKQLAGVRIDSGDLAYLSKKTREMLDIAGLFDTKIVVSNSLDEKIISSLLDQGSPIDSFGVGENLITAKSNPVFGGVYKLVAIEDDNKIIPKIKISDNVEKITNPHFKKIIRYYDNENKIISDCLYVYNENVNKEKVLLKHPENVWIKKEITNFTIKEIKEQYLKNGKIVHQLYSVEEVRQNVKREIDTLWEESLRLENPHTYIVNLSDKLIELKQNLLDK